MPEAGAADPVSFAGKETGSHEVDALEAAVRSGERRTRTGRPGRAGNEGLSAMRRSASRREAGRSTVSQGAITGASSYQHKAGLAQQRGNDQEEISMGESSGGMQAVRIRWTETTEHEVIVNMPCGIDFDTLNLADGLADLKDDGYQGVDRDGIDVEVLGAPKFGAEEFNPTC